MVPDDLTVQILTDVATIVDVLDETQQPRKKRKRNLNRNSEAGWAILHSDYFAEDALQIDKFRGCFCISRRLFLRIAAALGAHNEYFVQKADAAGLMGMHPFLKITATLRQLAYASPADIVGE